MLENNFNLNARIRPEEIDRLGRNDVCWCGSGKKFKKCHLGRSDTPRMKVSEAFEAVRSSNQNEICNCPSNIRHECSGVPIQSHTISKCLGLSTIQENGKVFSINDDFDSLKKNHGRLGLRKIGINQVSVFPGFCGKHDKGLFSEIEDAPFVASNKQCCLLAYRAVARERFTKISGIGVNDFMKRADSGRSLRDQMAMQGFLSDYGLGLSLAKSDFDHVIGDFHQTVEDQNYDRFEHLVFKFPPEFPVLCCTAHMPNEDWYGNQLQDLLSNSKVAEWVTVVSIQTSGASWIIFSWKCDAIVPSKFVHSLLAACKGREADALIKYFFSTSDNTAISPKWWNGLEDQQRKALEARLMDGIPKISGYVDYMLRPKPNEPVVIDLPMIEAFHLKMGIRSMIA